VIVVEFGSIWHMPELWELWKNGKFARAEIEAHPLGYQVRFYVRDEPFYTRVLETYDLAIAEAEAQRATMLADGWTGRPSMPL
jgi:hypothetical protein